MKSMKCSGCDRVDNALPDDTVNWTCSYCLPKVSGRTGKTSNILDRESPPDHPLQSQLDSIHTKTIELDCMLSSVLAINERIEAKLDKLLERDKIDTDRIYEEFKALQAQWRSPNDAFILTTGEDK